MAEWSKAVALGAIPKGREFEPHCHQILFCDFEPLSDVCLLLVATLRATVPKRLVDYMPQFAAVERK